MKKILALGLVLAFATGAYAQQTEEAFENATVNPEGIRTQDYFFNIQGVNNGDFATYGAARWETSGIKAAFDAQYGAGNWQVDEVYLELTQANAFFTDNGLVDIYWSADDATPMTPGASTPTYDFWSPDAAGDYGPVEFITQYQFTEVASGHVEQHMIYDLGNTGSANVAAEIEAGEILTLALLEGDPDVAATYAGHNNFDYDGPTLVVTAIPEPATLALLALGGVALIRRR